MILIGVPAAGKTTFYQQRFAATHRHVSRDLFSGASSRDPRLRRALIDALSQGAPVVVDNTNPRAADRAPVIALAHAHGARVVGYFFDVATREAVARNAGRRGRQNVPNVAIFTAAKRLEPPTMAEGFDQLFRIRPAPDRTFEVTEM